MKLPERKDNWPQLWHDCYRYDLLEVFDNEGNAGYTYAYLNRYNAICNNVIKYMPGGCTILDVAAAQGNFTLHLAEEGYNMIWNDLRKDLIGYVQLKYENGDVEYRPGNVFELNFAEKADGVIITEIIEHVAHPDEFLKKIATLVKAGGYIFMSTPLGSYFLNRLPKFSECEDPSQYEGIQFKPNSDGHIFLLHLDEIKKLAFDAGLTISEVSIYNNFLTSGHIKMQAILKILPKSIIDGIEKFTQRLPSFIKLKLHSNIAITFRKGI
jgi:2-polyprenyl-6-hydroxyphenyl methylase/3-demethylubiquinone-9 3-methyltransferase